MKIIFVLLSLGTILRIQTFGQERYEPAYIVNLKGDTTIGFIDNQNWLANPSEINFKQTPYGPIETFKPVHLLSFGFNSGEYFVSRLTVLHHFPDNIREVEELKDTVTTSGHFFLQVLYAGKANLYLFVDQANNDHFFIEKTGNQVNELVLKKMIGKSQSGLSSIVTINKYHQVLSYYFSDCPDINSKIKSTRYNETELINLFEYYSRCISTEGKVTQVKNRGVRFRIGVIGGFSISTLKFDSDLQYLDDIINARYDQSVNPSGGLRFCFELPRRNRTQSFVNDVIYSTSVVTGSYNKPGQGLLERFFDYSYMKIHSQLQFDLSNKTWRPYLKGGIGNNFILTHRTYQVITSTSGQAVVQQDALFANPRSYEFSFILSAGLSYKRFQLEISFEIGNGFTNFTYMGVNTISYQGFLGYFLH